MIYTNGNYECLAKPRIPSNAKNRKAYIVGGGLAGLSAAQFLIRDGGFKGENIYILEKENITGGGCDGKMVHDHFYLVRGGREMDNHFECLWDLFSSVPSVENKGMSVLDEYYYLDKDDPNSSPLRVMENRGKDANTLHHYTLSDKALLELSTLVLTKEEDLNGKTIDDMFTKEFFESNFWCFWRSMFAFETWHSAIEMRRYLTRFIHHASDISDLTCLRFGKYNTYDSFILPLTKNLETNNVNFIYDSVVDNVLFEFNDDKKKATKILYKESGVAKTIDLTSQDLLFVTLGSNVEESTLGNDNTPIKMSKELGDSWQLWKNISTQSKEFGHPDVFCGDKTKSNWESATITCLDDKIPDMIEKLLKRPIRGGKCVTGGPVTMKDSNWLISWTVSRQPHFRNQKTNEIVIWLYGLFTNKKGDYINKTMENSTGREILEEWLYHMGVDESEISELSTHAHTIPCMMPYCTSYFMKRNVDDRPKVVPDKAVNFAFIGEHVDTPRECAFTTELAVRTGMEAVYTLLDIERGVPEVYGSIFDIRCLLKTTGEFLEDRKIYDMKLPYEERAGLKLALKKIKGTVIEKYLKEYHII